MAVLIYALCTLTALACAALLLLGARRSGSRMLFWSGLCFTGLAVTNAMVVVDALGWVATDLWTLRLMIALLAVSLLLYGLVFEEK